MNRVRIPRGSEFLAYSQKYTYWYQRNQQLRAPSSLARHNSMRVDEGRNSSSLARQKTKATTVVGRGGSACACLTVLSHPESEREKETIKKCVQTIDGMSKN